MADPFVSEALFRDLDYTIGSREAAAVADWRDNSESAFHIMRDHPRLHATAIVSGLFGYRKPPGEDPERGPVGAFTRDSYEKMMMGSIQAYDIHGPRDLANLLLEAVIWPKAA